MNIFIPANVLLADINALLRFVTPEEGSQDTGEIWLNKQASGRLSICAMRISGPGRKAVSLAATSQTDLSGSGDPFPCSFGSGSSESLITFLRSCGANPVAFEYPNEEAALVKATCGRVGVSLINNSSDPQGAGILNPDVHASFEMRPHDLLQAAERQRNPDHDTVTLRPGMGKKSIRVGDKDRQITCTEKVTARDAKGSWGGVTVQMKYLRPVLASMSGWARTWVCPQSDNSQLRFEQGRFHARVAGLTITI